MINPLLPLSNKNIDLYYLDMTLHELEKMDLEELDRFLFLDSLTGGRLFQILSTNTVSRDVIEVLKYLERSSVQKNKLNPNPFKIFKKLKTDPDEVVEILKTYLEQKSIDEELKSKIELLETYAHEYKIKKERRKKLIALGLISLGIFTILGSFFISNFFKLRPDVENKDIRSITETEKIPMYKSIEDKLLNLAKAKNKSISSHTIRNFYENYREFANFLQNTSIEDLLLVLEYYSNNPYTFSNIYNNILNDMFLVNLSEYRDITLEIYFGIVRRGDYRDLEYFQALKKYSLDTKSRFLLIPRVVELFENIGLGDRVKVINLDTGSLEEKEISRDLINFFGNYSIATKYGSFISTYNMASKLAAKFYPSIDEIARKMLEYIKFPMHDKNTLWLIGNATMINSLISNIEPIVLEDQYGNRIYIGLNPHRNAWIIAEYIRRLNESKYNILKHPERYFEINSQILANIWSFFDRGYWIRFSELIRGKDITPLDESFWECVLLQFNLRNERIKFYSERNIEIPFPSHNSTKLFEIFDVPNSMNINDIRFLTVMLFSLDRSTYDLRNVLPGKPVEEYIKMGMIHGVEAAKFQLIQSHEFVNRVLKKMLETEIEEPEWLFTIDLWRNPNLTIHQYVKELKVIRGNLTYKDVFSLWTSLGRWIDRGLREMYETADKFFSIQQFLSNNWKSYRLFRYIIGYSTYPPAVDYNYPTETIVINYITPQTLRDAGFPAINISIDPIPPGNAAYEISVPVPSHIYRIISEKLIKNRWNLVGIFLGDGENNIERYIFLDSNWPIPLYLRKNPR